MCDSYRAQYGCNFISAMPINLYRTNDNYHPDNSNGLPAFIRRVVFVKINNDARVSIWGTGRTRREFLHVDDLAEACFFLKQNYNESAKVKIGNGLEISIYKIAKIIKEIIVYNESFEFDQSIPNGTCRKIIIYYKNYFTWMEE